jgi:hypothetical protein
MRNGTGGWGDGSTCSLLSLTPILQFHPIPNPRHLPQPIPATLTHIPRHQPPLLPATPRHNASPKRSLSRLDEVLPEQRLRQWVFTFPQPLPRLLAWEPDLLRRTLAVVTRAVEASNRRRTRAEDGRASRSGRSEVVIPHGWREPHTGHLANR